MHLRSEARESEYTDMMAPGETTPLEAYRGRRGIEVPAEFLRIRVGDMGERKKIKYFVQNRHLVI